MGKKCKKTQENAFQKFRSSFKNNFHHLEKPADFATRWSQNTFLCSEIEPEIASEQSEHRMSHFLVTSRQVGIS